MGNIPKGYKQTEVGVIPEDWEVKKLASIAEICTGSTPPTNDQSNYGNDYFFVTPSDLGKGRLIRDTEKKLSTKGFNLSRKYPEKSILFTCIGSTIGKSGIADRELTSNQQINSIFPNNTFDYDYLYYVLYLFSNKIKNSAGETAVPIINKAEFGEIPIPLPTKAEQTAVAEALSDADALISSLEKLIAKKRNIKQGTMQELLTGKKRLPGFRGEWEVKKLGEICSPSKARLNPALSTKNYKCVELEHLSQETGRLLGYVDSSQQLSQKSFFEKGDVLFGKLRPYLRKFLFADFGGVCSTEIWVLIPKESVVSNFLYYLIQTKRVLESANQSTGTKMPRAEWNTVGNLEIVCPPSKAEQTAIVQILSDMDEEMEQLEQKLDKYRMIKQGMMQELLTGRIRLI